MVSDALEQRIYELVRSHDGIYLFKKKELTPSTDLDSDLRLEDDEALALMDDFFTTRLIPQVLERSESLAIGSPQSEPEGARQSNCYA